MPEMSVLLPLIGLLMVIGAFAGVLAGLLGVGGGSCLDMAKTLSALYTNPGDPIQYRGFDQYDRDDQYVVQADLA